MLTRMTDQDWERVVQVFRAVRSRRGGKGRNDRRFLEAVHYFCVHNITWRALPAEFGNWNSIWKRFWRLSQTGVFEAFFDALAAMSRTAHLVQMFDSTVVRAHVSAAGAKGGRTARRWAARAAASRPRSTSRLTWMGDRSPSTSRKVRPVTARSSRFCSILGPTSRPARRWATKDTTARAIARPRASAVHGRARAQYTAARERSICPVIPFKSSARNRPRFFPRALYRARARIEQLVGKLKRFKRVALRCQKTAQNYGSVVALALGFILIKSVHTA
jgi:transposase